MEGVDVVHHNVALVPITKSGDKFWKVNVDGSRVAAEEAARAGVKAFIHMSSSSVFGCPSEGCPVTDQTPPHPVEIYGRAKLGGELAVREVCHREGLALIRSSVLKRSSAKAGSASSRFSSTGFRPARTYTSSVAATACSSLSMHMI